MEDKKTPGLDKYEISTPEVLKTHRKNYSPLSKYHLPPNRSSLSQSRSGFVEVERTPLDNNVLVFGFPDKFKSLVVDKFKRLGKVLEVRESEGNWINFLYADREAAAKALSLNFQYLTEGVLVGVKFAGALEVPADESGYQEKFSESFEYTQYLKKVPRRKAGFYEKFVRYILNYD
jgi:hypothetical protein